MNPILGKKFPRMPCNLSYPPDQNSKNGLHDLHKRYTIKSVPNAPVEYGKSGLIDKNWLEKAGLDSYH